MPTKASTRKKKSSSRKKATHKKATHKKASHKKTTHKKASHKKQSRKKQSTKSTRSTECKLDKHVLPRVEKALTNLHLSASAIKKILTHIANDDILKRLNLKGGKISAQFYDNSSDLNVLIGPRDFSFDRTGKWYAQGTMVSDAKWKG